MSVVIPRRRLTFSERIQLQKANDPEEWLDSEETIREACEAILADHSTMESISEHMKIRSVAETTRWSCETREPSVIVEFRRKNPTGWTPCDRP